MATSRRARPAAAGHACHDAKEPAIDAAAPTQAVAAPARQPAHRPSRRHLIVEAAIRVFARKGYADAGIQDVAEEADVVPTAVYYHFAGKEELFEVALRQVMEATDEVVRSVRPDGDAADADALSRVIRAVWDWIETHPDEAKLMHYHLPGATPQTRLLRQEFEEHHIQRAFDYLGGGDAPASPPPSTRAAAAQYGAHSLALRTLITLLMAIHPMRMEGGPLSRNSPKAVRQALDEVSRRLVLPV